MPVNPIPQPTKAEEAKAAADDAWLTTRRFVHKHSTVFAFIIVGIVLFSGLVAAEYAYTHVMMLGYWLAGAALFLDYLIRGR